MMHNFKHYLRNSLNYNFERSMTAAFGLTITALLLTALTLYPNHTGAMVWDLFGAISCLLIVIYLYARFEIAHGREIAQTRQEAREQTAHLLESITDAFLAIDGEGRLTYANSPAERLLEQKRDNLIGCPLQEALPTSLRSPLMRQYQEALNGQAARFECSDPASQCWYEVVICSTPEGASLALRDITGRKRVEEEQGRLLAILEATPDLIGINDMNGQICYFNRAGRQLLGLEELTGRYRV